MQKRAPTLANILVIVLFALSCFGLLLFLWESFGGPVPLKPKGYRFTIAFPRTLALAEQSDVRISGVNVGHVISLAYDKDGRAHVTIEIASKYAPIPSNMQRHPAPEDPARRDLRAAQARGASVRRSLPDGGVLPNAQVEPAVTLDDILSALTPETRKDFQMWMQSAGRRPRRQRRRDQLLLCGHPTFRRRRQQADRSRRLPGGSAHRLHSQHRRRLRCADRARGRVPRPDHQTASEPPTRSPNRARPSRKPGANCPPSSATPETALRSLDAFATNTVPLYNAIRPFEEKLTPLLQAVKPFTPPFNALLTSLGPFTKAAKTGLPAVKTELDLTTPLLAATCSALHNFNPFFQYASDYVPEIQALFANATAATQTHEKNTNVAVARSSTYSR